MTIGRVRRYAVYRYTALASKMRCFTTAEP
jgi:hypothetical protein